MSVPSRRSALLARIRIDPDRPPPGPFRPEFWRSPLRSTRLTSILGLVLLIGLPIIAVTGLLSNDAYQPGLGTNNLGIDVHGPLDLYLFHWPAGFRWLYAITQGAHVVLGLTLFPVVLVKLWSVIPKLFVWPPVRSPAHAIERLTLALLVGGALFEFVTGLLNIQYWYAFKFQFLSAHYYGGWIFIGALIAHVTVKFPTMARSLRTREQLRSALPAVTAAPGAGAVPRTASVAAEPTAGGAVTPLERDDLLSPNPVPSSMTRRALLGSVAVASGVMAVQGLGQTVGGPFRRLAFLLPRGMDRPGPLGFPVNRTFAISGIKAAQVSDSWRLKLVGKRTVTLTRDDLLAMTQHTHTLPIGCVEGWSTTQHWTGVRMADLARLVGANPSRVSAESISVETGSAYAQATIGYEEVSSPLTLLALKVNGVDLDLDHGYPARVIGPAIQGVHCTKWVGEIRFAEQV